MTNSAESVYLQKERIESIICALKAVAGEGV